jgi:hypothetical protein
MNFSSFGIVNRKKKMKLSHFHNHKYKHRTYLNPKI